MTITVHARSGRPAQGLLCVGTRAFPCALGRAGIAARKREGDGATPLGSMGLLGGYFSPRASQDMQPLRTRLPMRPIRADLGWCDSPADPCYNRPVKLPFRAGHERMARPDRLYDVVLVLDWNVSARRRGKGSAIFLHLARPGFAPTEGCIAVSRRTMARLLPLLATGAVVRVVR